MDLTLLEEITTQSTAGNGYSGLRIAFKDDLEAIPLPSDDDKGVISDDFIFKAGKDWLSIFSNEKEFQVTEENGEVLYQIAYTSSLNVFIPGENKFWRQFVNEGNSIKDIYVLLDSCTPLETMVMGKGKCCPARMKVNFDSGKATTDPKGFTITITVEQEGLNCKYEGVGAANATFQIGVDETTPDVSKGTATYLLPENTGATEITTLANAVIGTLVTLKWQSTTNHSTLTSGVVFQLAGAFTPATGATLTLQVTTAGTFAERHRHLP